MVKFKIHLPPVTKKNSPRIFKKKTKTGKLVPFIVPSERFMDYQAKCWVAVPKEETITTPINIKAIYYMPTKRRVDITNLHSALHDVLVHYKVIEDDNCKIVVSTDGSRVSYSKESPRTEVEITDSDYVCWENKEQSQSIMLDHISPNRKRIPRRRRVLV